MQRSKELFKRKCPFVVSQIMIYLFAVLLIIITSSRLARAQECYREDQRIPITKADQMTNVILRDDEFLIYILGIREVQVSGQSYDVHGIRQCGNKDIELEDPRVQTCNSGTLGGSISAIYFSCMDLFNEGSQQADIQIYAYPKTDNCSGSDFRFLLINTTGS